MGNQGDQPASRSQLTELVLAQVDTSPKSLHLSPVGTGKHNRSYWVDTDRGRFVLRIAPPDDAGFLFYEHRMMRQEPQIHGLVQEHTSIPIAEIAGYDFSRVRIDRDYLLLEALPGTPLSDARLNRRQIAETLRQVGRHLRALHDLTADSCLHQYAYGYLGSHRPMEPQPDWASAFQVMWNLLLDDVVACGSYTSQEAHALRDLLDRHYHHFDRPVRPRLLHMDIWSQNILVDARGSVTGLVDFDRALWGDKEIEFAVLDYCGISEPAFWQGYGAARDESPPAQIRRQFYLLYEVQKYMPIRVWRRKDPRDAERYKRYARALAAPLLEF